MLLSQSVGDALGAYIEVHNRIFQQASTFRSVLKNVFGKGVPMEELLADAEGLVPGLASVRSDVAAFRAEVSQDMKPEYLRYLTLLESYAGTLQDTVNVLVRRQRLLAEGARGGRGNPMSWQAFQGAEREYVQAIERYKLIGRELNEAAPLVFG